MRRRRHRGVSSIEWVILTMVIGVGGIAIFAGFKDRYFAPTTKRLGDCIEAAAGDGALCGGGQAAGGGAPGGSGSYAVGGAPSAGGNGASGVGNGANGSGVGNGGVGNGATGNGANGSGVGNGGVGNGANGSGVGNGANGNGGGMTAGELVQTVNQPQPTAAATGAARGAAGNDDPAHGGQQQPGAERSGPSNPLALNRFGWGLGLYGAFEGWLFGRMGADSAALTNAGSGISVALGTPLDLAVNGRPHNAEDAASLAVKQAIVAGLARTPYTAAASVLLDRSLGWIADSLTGGSRYHEDYDGALLRQIYQSISGETGAAAMRASEQYRQDLVHESEAYRREQQRREDEALREMMAPPGQPGSDIFGRIGRAGEAVGHYFLPPQPPGGDASNVNQAMWTWMMYAP